MAKRSEDLKGKNNNSSSSTEKTSTPKKSPAQKKQPPTPWYEFIQTAKETEIRQRYSKEIKQIVTKYPDISSQYCCLSLMALESSINTYHLDRIFEALKRENQTREKDVLLILLSTGGNIEPAYQISKICKSFAKEKFVVAIPREAKSAATLIALGADEIHMSQLGQLGPIDPQLGGLPALGVSQALKSIAALSEQFPKSSEMFAHYLRLALTVEQIGYCERISESAIQYAERLLSTKTFLGKKIPEIAKELVYEYKDHGFVIDIEEAKQHLGDAWIKTDTPELELAEKIYSLFDFVSLFLRVDRSKRLLVIGEVDEGTMIFDKK